MTELPPSPPGPPRWATRIRGRKPEFKFHRNLGHAKLAVGMSWNYWNEVRGGDIYEWIDGQWQLVLTIDRGTAPSKLPWRKNDRTGKD